ncbi:DUF1992 domain-containing protein [Pannonibacter phragmitetus]|uniref:DnaJ family domain-containing protein n=1 Tax=Pannonibacter phragmitetus TaxID=121719 RepID=UPI003D2F381C
MRLSDLAESQILKAQAEGQFDNLKGAGKPLNLAADGGSAEAIGFRIMAEAGALPREIDLQKAVQDQARILQETVGEDARKREMRKLADLQMRLEMEREARRSFFGG